MNEKIGIHLDLGCGKSPRNPYGFKSLHALDIYEPEDLPINITFTKANLTLQPIPYADNTFDSISAYDFIEHIPRILAINQDTTKLPFVDLMSEIWRVLKPNGMFYALTPAFPNGAAFHDPTHVNFITERTHKYFCGSGAYAIDYGFKGQFEAVKVEWIRGDEVFREIDALEKIRRWYRNHFKKRKNSHLIWELKAIK